MTSPHVTIWQIHDGKPGHRNQLRGLCSALSEIVSTEVHEVRAPSRRVSISSLWSKRLNWAAGLPDPELILGAGHSTHLAMLAARRARGGRTIVMMKPSLPPALFDLCIVPEHDQVAASAHIVTTRGVLNAIRPSRQQTHHVGLLLIGGPSSAHGWSDEQMRQQVESVVTSSPNVQWSLTTSRRTPTSFLSILADRRHPNLTVTPHEETDVQWVPQALRQASQIWVSEDSVSMVYEALTSGAAVGVFGVPSLRRGRVAAGIDKLIESGFVTAHDCWTPGSRLAAPPEQLDEARRCAKIVSQRLLQAAAA